MDILQCVIVLYGSAGADFETIRCLASVRQEHPQIAERIAVLVYDNSAQPHDVWGLLSLFASAQYIHDSGNPGLAVAYNVALESARRCASSWVLLLDQDTHLTYAFLRELLDKLEEGVSDAVGAIVPKLIQGETILSPQLTGTWNKKSVSLDVSGISSRRLTALNTGACVRVNDVKHIGGFPLDYPLDYLDHALFFRLQKSGQQVYILKSRLQHHLSLLNMEEEMPPSRYRQVLEAEWRFVLATGDGGGQLMHRLRLFKRAVKQMGLANKVYASLTWKAAMSNR